MNEWNPYMNDAPFYDEGYDVDDMMRHHDNNAPALPMMPTTQTMPTMYTPASPCGCQPTSMWHGAAPTTMGGAYPMAEMEAPGMGMMPSSPAPMSGMPMMPSAYPYPMPSTPTQMPTGPMSYPYGPGYYGMPPFPYGYYPHR